MLEMGKCKTKFPKYSQWYETLSLQQRRRVDDLKEILKQRINDGRDIESLPQQAKENEELLSKLV